MVSRILWNKGTILATLLCSSTSPMAKDDTCISARAPAIFSLITHSVLGYTWPGPRDVSPHMFKIYCTFSIMMLIIANTIPLTFQSSLAFMLFSIIKATITKGEKFIEDFVHLLWSLRCPFSPSSLFFLLYFKKIYLFWQSYLMPPFCPLGFLNCIPNTLPGIHNGNCLYFAYAFSNSLTRATKSTASLTLHSNSDTRTLTNSLLKVFHLSNHPLPTPINVCQFLFNAIIIL